ncbi:hypothetical protein ACQ4PT_027547 [Festuca glaucescens]
MAATISFLALLFLLHGVAGDSQVVKKVCAGTPYPDFCGSTLSTVPQNATGNANKVTYWVLDYTIRIGGEAERLGSTLYLETDLPLAEGTCISVCQRTLAGAVEDLYKAQEKYPDYAAMVTQTRRALAVAKKAHIAWNCESCRKGDSKKKVVDALSEGNDLGKAIAVLAALVNPVQK